MTLRKQFMTWIKSIAFGSVFLFLLGTLIYQSGASFQGILLMLATFFTFAILFTLPIQIILYFLVNKTHSISTLPNASIYFVLIFAWLITIICFAWLLKWDLTLITLFFISYVPISLIHFYKAFTE